MKPIHFLPPLAALVIAGIWIGGQRRSIASLERQSAFLQKAITAKQSSANAADAGGSRPAAPGTETKDKGPIDWKKIAAQLEESRNSGGMVNMRSFMSLQKKLMSMSKDELAAALGEIASLDLPERSRRMLESMLVGKLLEKDPEFALTRFIGRIQADNGAMNWQLSHALGEWAAKDPAAATAWFDRQIAAGTFVSKSLDGKSESRTQFEASIIGKLLSSNPEAAALRLAALPEDQRREVLMDHAADSLKQEDQMAYAGLVRQSLPEKDQIDAIARLVSQQADSGDDYSSVTECMDRIKATPAEREAGVVKAAESKFQSLSYQRKITREDIETMRNWATTQSPVLADRATGKALSGALQGGGKMEFSETAGLALGYHDAGGSDELLVPLLKSSQARDHKEQAIELAGKISDETVREKILKSFR